MPLYNRGSLDPNASVASPEYLRASLQHYRADLEPARRQAQRELQDELAGRGLSPVGGQRIAAELALRNNFNNQISKQGQVNALGQSNAAEMNRQRLESRALNAQDQLASRGLEDEMYQQQKDDAELRMRQRYLGEAVGALGKIGGDYAGRYYGGLKKTPAVRVVPDTGQLEPPIVRY